MVYFDYQCLCDIILHEIDLHDIDFGVHDFTLYSPTDSKTPWSLVGDKIISWISFCEDSLPTAEYAIACGHYSKWQSQAFQNLCFQHRL